MVSGAISSRNRDNWGISRDTEEKKVTEIIWPNLKKKIWCEVDQKAQAKVLVSKWVSGSRMLPWMMVGQAQVGVTE